MRSGIFKEVLAMAVDSIKTHKLRSFLTILGIMIGVMTVIAMVSVIQGLNKSFLSQLESVGTDLILVSKYEPGIRIGRMSEEERTRKDLTFEDAEAIQRECPLIKAVAVDLAANIFEGKAVKYQNLKNEDAFILGMNHRFPDVLSVYLPVKGRFISESDVIHTTKIAVLGSDLNDALFPNMNALGKSIRIGPEEFIVVGVLKKRGSMFGMSRDNFVGIPLTTLMKYFPYQKDNLEVIAVPRKHEDLLEAMEQVTGVLRKQRKVPYGKPNDFAVFSQDTMVGLYNQITGAAYLVMVVISSIGLMVGGIGVMNIMLVSVKERTREIGIRKAIGAKASDIMKQFLMEAVILTGGGGIIGIFLGFGIGMLVKVATPLPATVSLWSVILGFVVSVSIGLFFGIFPARKAARMDPIVSLRYE